MQKVINATSNIELIEKIVKMNPNITTITIIDRLPDKKVSSNKIYLKLCSSCRDFFLFIRGNWLLVKHEELHDRCAKCNRRGTLNCNKEIAKNMNN